MSSSGKAGGSLTGADRKFATQAASDGLAEVALGNLAQQKASSEQVKQFASRMVQDHTNANNELMQIASTKGVDAPTG
ncbi:MAG: DUF4142 domain-containing protein, partial [Rhizobacter sp.]